MTGGVVPVAAGVASYAALSAIANHSPLKSVFNAFNKKLAPSTREYLSNKLDNILLRSGYFLDENGTFDFNSKEKK